MASILLNSKAVDFVVTGCGTGQGALMSLNIHPGVTCGYCIDPADAFLSLGNPCYLSPFVLSPRCEFRPLQLIREE